MTTSQKLQRKAEACSGDNAKMPPILEIEKMLVHMDIKHVCKDYANIPECKGTRYANRNAKKLTIMLNKEDSDKLGFYCIELDSSFDDYSSDTRKYAMKIVQLLKLKDKL